MQQLLPLLPPLLLGTLIHTNVRTPAHRERERRGIEAIPTRSPCPKRGCARTFTTNNLDAVLSGSYSEQTSPLSPPPPFHQAKNTANAAANQQQQSGDTSVHGQSGASLPVAAGNSKLDHQHPEASGGGGAATAGVGSSTTGAGAGAGGGDDGVDAGIDLSKETYRAGADEAGARMLCAWLNANVATTFIEVQT